MKARNPVLTTTLTAASAAVFGQRFVGFDGAPAGLNGLAKGVALHDANVGEDYPCDVLGETVVEAGGPVSALDLLSADADSRAVAGGTKPCARALESATASGELIRILLLPNNS